MTLAQADFRAAMARFTTGVTVVTTGYASQPYGLTVSAFCSVSLDPPLVLVSLDQASRTCAMIRASGTFAVNVLTARQEPLAVRFARKEPHGKTFMDIPHHVSTLHAPLFDEALACIECQVAAIYPGGDHLLLLGHVTSVGRQDETPASEPLLYYNTAFRTIR